MFFKKEEIQHADIMEKLGAMHSDQEHMKSDINSIKHKVDKNTVVLERHQLMSERNKERLDIAESKIDSLSLPIKLLGYGSIILGVALAAMQFKDYL